MHFTILIVCQRILLQAFRHFFISYHYRSIIGIGLNHQFQYIQEFTGISTRKAKHRVRFLQLDMLLLQNNILGDGDMQEFQQIIFFQ